MESTATAIIFIIGKAAIWLVIPLLFGLYEMRRHRRMMAAEARGETPEPTIPRWLRQPAREAARPAPRAPEPARDPEPVPLAAEAGREEPRRAA